MSRRRRLPLALGVCIGTFLLLFSVVGAHALKEPPTAHERQHPSDAEASERNRTLLGKISDEHVPPENAEGSVERSNEGGQDRVKNSKTEDEEKVPTSLDKDHKVQGIRSRDNAERSSTSDSSGGTRYDEILYGTSGKSSSTKAVSEDFYRLSRTNGLTTVTTKPAFEEARLEEKRNRTAANSSHLVDNNSSHGETNGTERLDAAGKGRRESDEKNQPSSGEGSTERVKSKRKYSDSLKVEEEESATRGELAKEEEEETAMSKNSEVSDLKGEDGDSISLINDTYVNYSHYYKTSTDKNLEGSQSRAPENGTNFISEDRSVSHEWQDPKEEVEVVRNVTHAPIERFVDGIRNSGQLQNTSTNDAFNNELHDRGTNLSNGNTTKEVNEMESELEEESTGKSLKLIEVTTTRIEEGNDQQTPQTSSSPVPRGRTIAFSGINEFPGLEAKASSSKEDPSVSKKNISSEKAVEQKPYPYLKSTIEPLAIHDTSERPKEEDTTEETSAFENTIGKVQSGEKFVITEPSVVIENSIQQFKPTHRDKSVNESSSNSTSKPSSPMTTVAPIVSKEVKPTDEIQVDQSYDLETKVTGKTDEKSESTGNDVPRGNEGSEVITVKENFDVTGNGITEVSSRGESNADKRTTERTYKLSFQAEIANGTTVAPTLTESAVKPQTEGKVLSNVDVQTNAEESLLIRSTLNVTELSTEYPLTKENTSDGEKFTTSIANTLNSAVIKVPENVTVLPVIEESSTMSTLESFDKNGTNEIPFGSRITLSPDENSAPTVTSVEYEFVGLSEATVVPNTNTTEAPEEHHEGNVTTSTIAASTVQDLDFKNSSEEGTTLSAETVADFTTTGETEVTIENSPFTTVVTDQTVFSMTTNIRDFTTVSTIEEETQGTTKEDEVLRTTSTVESWSTVSDTDVITITTTDVPFGSPGPKDSEFSPNVTESSMDDVMTTNTTGSITKGTTISPTMTDNLGPRIVVPSSQSTPSTTEISTERTTDVTLMSLSPDEITSLVRIVMKGSWHDVCPHMGNLRLTLAEILRSGMNKSVYAKQIMFHQNPCLEPLSPTPTPTDVALTSILVYVVDENGKFDDSMTSILPSLYNDSRVSFPVTIHSFLLVQETDSGNAIAVIVVSSVAFICLILLAGLLFIMRKRQTRFNYGERCRPVSLDAYSLDSVSAYNSVRRKDVARSSKRSYGNPTFEDSSAIPSHPLNFAGLSSFCNDVNAINEEFTGIPQVSAKIDELPAGAEVKNRYANVIPLPETRVPLQKMNNDPLTEYINASYVRGPKNATRYYIACQGPMETTVTDFWRMVWEQQCKVIIMLTDLVENGVEKCTEYIPPSEVTDCHRLYGDFQVTLKKRETKEKYAISTLHLKNLENNTFREVYHIWYLWPVNGVQSDGAGLIAVLLEARALQRGGPGPIVVHCSPGTGRTGTLIALDLGIRQYEITRTVDVPRVVYTIRRDRAGAVQTKEQYAFIYKALNLYATKLAGGVLEST